MRFWVWFWGNVGNRPCIRALAFPLALLLVGLSAALAASLPVLVGTRAGEVWPVAGGGTQQRLDAVDGPYMLCFLLFAHGCPPTVKTMVGRPLVVAADLNIRPGRGETPTP